MTESVPPKKLAIYYGWPIAVNGKWSVSEAVDVFNDYDIVIFGEGLEDPSHPQYLSTNDIISQTNAKIYGYVDATLNSTNFESKVNNWCDMGGTGATGNEIEGIFCDQFGFDYGLTRQKQNDEIDYIHSKSKKAFVNAWNPDDVFKTQTGTTGATGTSMTLDDWYLAESYQIINGNYRNVSDWKAKADKMKDYKINGPGYSKMATCTSYDGSNFDQEKWDYAYYSTALYGFDASGWGEQNFSAPTAQMPFRTRKKILGSKLVGNINEASGVFKINTNIGIKVDTNNKKVYLNL